MSVSKEIRGWAVKGARGRLEEIRLEEKKILAAFPELGQSAGPAPKATNVAKPGNKRRKMSPAARKRIAARMKQIWAERRKSKK